MLEIFMVTQTNIIYVYLKKNVFTTAEIFFSFDTNTWEFMVFFLEISSVALLNQ